MKNLDYRSEMKCKPRINYPAKCPSKFKATGKRLSHTEPWETLSPPAHHEASTRVGLATSPWRLPHRASVDTHTATAELRSGHGRPIPNQAASRAGLGWGCYADPHLNPQLVLFTGAVSAQTLHTPHRNLYDLKSSAWSAKPGYVSSR